MGRRGLEGCGDGVVQVLPGRQGLREIMADRRRGAGVRPGRQVLRQGLVDRGREADRQRGAGVRPDLQVLWQGPVDRGHEAERRHEAGAAELKRIRIRRSRCKGRRTWSTKGRYGSRMPSGGSSGRPSARSINRRIARREEKTIDVEEEWRGTASLRSMCGRAEAPRSEPRGEVDASANFGPISFRFWRRLADANSHRIRSNSAEFDKALCRFRPNSDRFRP